MRRWLKILIPTLVLAGGAVLCAIRWQAWFGMPAEPRWNEETNHYVFHSFERDTTPASLDILVLGDVHSRLKRVDYDSLAARVPQADAVAQTGDWMERGQNYYYQMLLREWMPSALSGLPVITTPGNHEYSKGINKHISPIWKEAFPHPDNGPREVPGASYYIDFPQMRFIVIDTNPMERLVNLTRTLTWLRRLQKEAGGRYVVVMMHHPVLSTGKGRWNTLIYSVFRHALGQADLVISGHDHSYMRRTPFVVLNTAGEPKEQQFLYTPDYADTTPVYGVIKLQYPFSNLQFTVHRLSDGIAIDSLHVSHH